MILHIVPLPISMSEHWSLGQHRVIILNACPFNVCITTYNTNVLQATGSIQRAHRSTAWIAPSQSIDKTLFDKLAMAKSNEESIDNSRMYNLKAPGRYMIMAMPSEHA